MTIGRREEDDCGGGERGGRREVGTGTGAGACRVKVTGTTTSVTRFGFNFLFFFFITTSVSPGVTLTPIVSIGVVLIGIEELSEGALLKLANKIPKAYIGSNQQGRIPAPVVVVVPCVVVRGLIRGAKGKA